MSGNSRTDRPWFDNSDFACNPGLSIYWIIQRVFIEPITEYIACLGYTLPERIRASFGGYEPPGKILTYEKKESGICITGEKGFITGAFDSDLLFLSARKPGEGKTSSLILLKNEGIIRESLTDLKLQAFKKISHASLKLNKAVVKDAILINDNPSKIRKIIKSGFIMERIMILEMSIYYAKFLIDQINNSELSREAGQLAEKATAAADLSYENFKIGEKIFEYADLKKSAYSLFSQIEAILPEKDILKTFPEYPSEISFLKKFLLT